MQELQNEGGFPTFRDVLLLAAAVGYRNDRRVPFTGSGEPIRYDTTMIVPAYSETLISMIAANVVTDDPEIMDDARLEERVEIFEEYANGGLEFIQEQVNVRHQTAALVVTDLVTESLSESGGAQPVSVDELLGGVSWS